MSDSIQQYSPIEIRKVKEYETYVQWHTMPSHFRGLTTAALKDLGIPKELHTLLSVKSHNDFSKKYGIDNNTLRKWRGMPQFENDIMNDVDQEIFNKYYARVMHSFTLKTIEHGDAQRMNLWLSKFAGHVERFQIDTTITTEEGDVILPEDGAHLMSAVLSKLAMKRGIGSKRMDSLVEDVEHEVVDLKKLPSQTEYDFKQIAKNNKKSKQVKASTSDGDSSKKDKEALRKKLMENVRKIADGAKKDKNGKGNGKAKGNKSKGKK